ncbi:MAG: hypothetical protein U5S82_13670 [Gammaproteobacteria bacterium]|nr:hypothetical protein [Gammaproteobacteria bacterium]
MNSNSIYVVSPTGLQRLTQAPFASEDDFQALLERYPDLLPGDQISPDKPCKWLLVAREAGIADSGEGGDRWSVDHLFVDQEGIPTFVEVKRGTDTRVRREVVGQILEYAANATAYWPEATLSDAFAETASAGGDDPDRVLAEFLGEKESAEAFWDRVWTNLRAGKVRLLIVADRVPDNLQVIVEFLNNQMSPAEVLAVELQHFSGNEIRTLVPRVVGRTAQAEAKKKPRPRGRAWDRESLLEVLTKRRPDQVSIATEVLDWAEVHPRITLRFGRGATTPTISFDVHAGEARCAALYVAVADDGLAGNIQFGLLKTFPPFQSVEERRAVAERFLEIYPGLDTSNLDRYPILRLEGLAEPGVMAILKETMEWIAEKLNDPVDPTEPDSREQTRP